VIEASYTRALRDSGHVGGGSARVGDANIDVVAPLSIAVATALDEAGHLVDGRRVRACAVYGAARRGGDGRQAGP